MADNQNLSERLEYTVEPIEDKDLKTKNDLYDGVNADKLDVESIQNNLDLDEYLKEVQTDNIVDAAVTEVKIFDASVTVDKLADDSVTNNKIADDAVRTEKIKIALSQLQRLQPLQLQMTNLKNVQEKPTHWMSYQFMELTIRLLLTVRSTLKLRKILKL